MFKSRIIQLALQRRKLAALEIEQLVKNLKIQGKAEEIMKLIDALNTYALSSQVNVLRPVQHLTINM